MQKYIFSLLKIIKLKLLRARLIPINQILCLKILFNSKINIKYDTCNKLHKTHTAVSHKYNVNKQFGGPTLKMLGTTSFSAVSFISASWQRPAKVRLHSRAKFSLIAFFNGW